MAFYGLTEAKVTVQINGTSHPVERDGKNWRLVLLAANFKTKQGQAFIGYGTQLERLIGSPQEDKLTGNVAANEIVGGAGADHIWGGAGADYLDGGAGVDNLDGFRVIIMTVANSLRKSRVSDSLLKVETSRFKSLSIA